MEAPAVDEIKKLEEAKLTSAAAFVEGGIQEACDDACSICLEEFCESDPSTVTDCKHEFHLQCILEWCQRSSQCPMCWQPINLKDPTSQELLDAVVQERNIRLNPPRNAAIFHHPTLGDFEIQHLPVGVNSTELEERIIQHLTAAAAMGRARHFSRRERHRIGSSDHAGPTSPERENGVPLTLTLGASPSSPLFTSEQSVYTSPNQSSQAYISPGPSASTNQHRISQHNRTSPTQAPTNQDRAGPSDLQSFSEALKSRFNSMSMRYKDSISKSTRGWRERWFSRNSTVADPGSQSQVIREPTVGISAVPPVTEHVETREIGSSLNSAPSVSDVDVASGPSVQQISNTGSDHSSGNHVNEASQSGVNHLNESCIETPLVRQNEAFRLCRAVSVVDSLILVKSGLVNTFVGVLYLVDGFEMYILIHTYVT
ncbi:hypothetical protein V2J09_006931 [Rumex salicifolius]